MAMTEYVQKENREVFFLPNEIFGDLLTSIKSFDKRAFAYSYYAYITYLYRYCKYIDSNGNRTTQADIKQYLGYSPINKPVDSIIKKNGILDSIGYTMTTTDYPISWQINEYNDVEFTTINDIKEGIINRSVKENTYKCKMPVKAFYRNTETNSSICDGTFFDVANTHSINYNIMERIIQDKQLGVKGLYIYGFLKHKSQFYKIGYQATYDKLSQELGSIYRTLVKYIRRLEEIGLIAVDIHPFRGKEAGREANVYHVLK